MLVAAVSALGLLIGPVIAAISASIPDRSGGGGPFLACAKCGADLNAATLLPVFGWNRPCSVCSHVHAGEARSARILSLTGALLFGLVAWAVGASWELVPMLLFVAALMALSAVDIQRYRLPDRLLFPSLAVCGIAILVVSVLGGETDHLLPAVVGGAAYFLMLLIPNLVTPTGLAFGDVKLAALLGLFVGWMRDSVTEGVVLVVYALILGMVLGVASGLAVGIGRRIIGPDFLPDPDFPLEPDERVRISKTAFPFGPALAVSALAIILTSSSLLGTPGLF